MALSEVLSIAVKHYGEDLFNHPKRLKAFLSDYKNQLENRDLRILDTAISLDILHEMIAVRKKPNSVQERMADKLCKKLVEDGSIIPERAKSLIQELAIVLWGQEITFSSDDKNVEKSPAPQTKSPPSKKSPAPQTKSAETWVVPTACRTLEKAYNAAKDGDTILLKPGRYFLTTTQVLNKSITLCGSTGTPQDVVVEYYDSDTFRIESGSPRIKAISIRSRGKNGSGIRITGGTPHISQTDIFSEHFHGLDVNGVTATPILDQCTLHDCGMAGMVFRDSARGTVQNCNIYGNTLYGMDVKTNGNPTVRGCDIHDGKDAGVFVHESGKGTFENCKIHGNTTSGIAVQTSGNPTVRGCDIYDGKNAGVYVCDAGSGTFENCKIHGNALPGMDVKTNGNPTVRGCDIRDGKDAGVFVHESGKGTFE
ncbi:MAG: right-handed parallel beta-helix repeat-containing protein, partial [Planctomycetia bacterium]|nr:right-handed parallel beta-helix repeat-containing protein [Planctomycetia bacterium]